MNQSSFIAAVLLAGFVLFLAAKGRLAAYTAVLWGNTAASVPGASAAPASVVKSPIPGNPGLNLSNPFAGLPSSITTFLGL